MEALNIAKLKICQHFDRLISELDIHIEEILNLESEKIYKDDLVNLRTKYLNEIEGIKHSNMELCYGYHESSIKFTNLEKSSPIDEIIKHNCYFIYKYLHEKLPPYYQNGILTVTDWPLSLDEKNLMENLIRDQEYALFIIKFKLKNPSPLFQHTYSLSRAFCEVFGLLKQIEIQEKYPIIKLSKESKLPISIKNIHFSQFEKTVLDYAKIDRLENIYLDDLSSLNFACSQENYITETMDLHYHTHLEDSSFVNLNFDKFKNLKKLHLTNHQLKIEINYKMCLNEEMFIYLQKLEDLKIDDFRIKQLYDNQFKNLKQLKFLCINRIDLNSNVEDMVDRCSMNTNNNLNSLLHGLGNIESLNLSRCNLEYSHLSSLNNLTKLKDLNLSYNNIKIDKSKIESMTKQFLDLENLEKLNLSFNNINYISKSLFDFLNNLEYLDLSNNQLESIENFALLSLEKLKVLILEKNTNSFLNPYTFKGLTSLEELSMHSTFDHLFNCKSFSELVNLKSLSLFLSGQISLRDSELKGELILSNFRNLENLIVHVDDIFFETSFINNFKKLKKLKLYLDSCPTSRITDCQELISNIRFNEFQKIEKLGVFVNLGIKNLGAIASSKSLTVMNLGGNSIDELDDDVFAELSNLEYLNLGINKLKKINGKLFKKLYKLKRLILHENELEDLSPDSFENLISLKYLGLNTNNLTRLNIDIFKNLRNLKYLALSCNDLVLDKEHFKNLNRLSILCLSYTDVVIDDLFAYVRNLHSLSLEYCFLPNISERAFKNLTNLSELTLTGSKIREINSDAFLDLHKLEILALDHNLIESIDNLKLENLQNLKSLNLGINKIKSIDTKILDKFKANSNIRVSLYGNNMQLDRNMKDKYKKSIHFCYQIIN